MENKLFVVGVGPGEASLLTIRSKEVLEKSDVLIFPNKDKDSCTSYSILKEVLDVEEKKLCFLDFPMTKDPNILEQAHVKASKLIHECVSLYSQVSFVVLGDPTLYSSFFHLEAYIEDLDIEIISGISSIHAVASALQIPLGSKREEVHIFPSSYSIENSFSLKGTLVFMKAGKQLESLKSFLREQRKEYDFEVYGASNCGMEGQVLCHNMEELDRLSGYYTIVIVKNIVSKEKQYKFFQHRNCEFFPCHKMENISDFNCLFCFCPFYSLGESCGGNFTYSQKGIKSCVNCTYPHDKKNYNEIMNRLKG